MVLNLRVADDSELIFLVVDEKGLGQGCRAGTFDLAVDCQDDLVQRSEGVAVSEQWRKGACCLLSVHLDLVSTSTILAAALRALVLGEVSLDALQRVFGLAAVLPVAACDWAAELQVCCWPEKNKEVTEATSLRGKDSRHGS